MVDGGWTRVKRVIFERISRWRKGMCEGKFGAEAGGLFGRNVGIFLAKSVEFIK